MIKKRVPLNETTNILNLDSLVDIVSNKVGILIILAVFTAMLTLIEERDSLNNDEPLSNIEKIKIPWARSSQKNILLFLLRDDRLFFFDRAMVFNRLKKYLSGNKPLPKQISLDDFIVKQHNILVKHGYTKKQADVWLKEWKSEFFYSGQMTNERASEILNDKKIEYKPKTLIDRFLELESK